MSRLASLFGQYRTPNGWGRRVRKACVCCGVRDSRTAWSWQCALCKYWGDEQCPRVARKGGHCQ